MHPSLTFRGDCEAAFTFYAQHLGAGVGAIFRYGGSPLAGGGTVVISLEKTFWAERFGMVVDRFAVPWLINCEGAEQPASV